MGLSPKGLVLVVTIENHISTVASQQEGSGFEPVGLLGYFCVESACSPCVCVGSLWVPPTVQTYTSLLGSAPGPCSLQTIHVYRYELVLKPKCLHSQNLQQCLVIFCSSQLAGFLFFKKRNFNLLFLSCMQRIR